MLRVKNIFSDHQGNSFRISSVLQVEQEATFQNFSAKYVVSGNENYLLNNRKFEVKEGEYLIGNKNTFSKVSIDNTTPVNGICIDISKKIITEIIEHQFDNPHHFSRFLFEQEWSSQKYNSKNTFLGYALQQLSLEFNHLASGKLSVNNELFYAIAENIVKDQSLIFERFSQLKAIKEETNGRLFNYVHDAKNFIDLNYLQDINLEQISIEAKLSQYHFIRLFKTIFGNSPYQYILKKKFQFAKELLENEYSTTTVSDLLGYNDTAAFSNAFKNHFGFYPSRLK